MDFRSRVCRIGKRKNKARRTQTDQCCYYLPSFLGFLVHLPLTPSLCLWTWPECTRCVSSVARKYIQKLDPRIHCLVLNRPTWYLWPSTYTGGYRVRRFSQWVRFIDWIDKCWFFRWNAVERPRSWWMIPFSNKETTTTRWAGRYLSRKLTPNKKKERQHPPPIAISIVKKRHALSPHIFRPLGFAGFLCRNWIRKEINERKEAQSNQQRARRSYDNHDRTRSQSWYSFSL